MYTEERPRVNSHVENSWYINRHDHHYLRRTMGEHVGNVNTNRARSNSRYNQSKLEDIMIGEYYKRCRKEGPMRR